MINLLPPERAAQIRYGRINSLLRRWLAAAGIAILILVVIIASGLVYINQQSKGLLADIAATNQELSDQNLKQIQADAATISGDVKVINQVLNKEVRVSDLMTAIGQYMPAGAILSSLTLGSVTGAIDLTASTVDYSSAAQIAVNLSDPASQLFSKVDIVSISCQNSHPGTSYACAAVYKALFSKAAASNFVNPVKGGS